MNVVGFPSKKCCSMWPDQGYRVQSAAPGREEPRLRCRSVGARKRHRNVHLCTVTQTNRKPTTIFGSLAKRKVQPADADSRDPPELLHVRPVGAGQRCGGGSEQGCSLRLVQHTRSGPGKEARGLPRAKPKPSPLALVLALALQPRSILVCPTYAWAHAGGEPSCCPTFDSPDSSPARLYRMIWFFLVLDRSLAVSFHLVLLLHAQTTSRPHNRQSVDL